MGVINSFTFNNINSLDMGIYVSGKDTFNSPQRNYDRSSIPGRNGDLLIDYGTFSNVDINYDAIVLTGKSFRHEIIDDPQGRTTMWSNPIAPFYYTIYDNLHVVGNHIEGDLIYRGTFPSDQMALRYLNKYIQVSSEFYKITTITAHNGKGVRVAISSTLITSYEEIATNAKSWLLSANGYCRLEDTYHPDYYRMGYFEGPIDFDTILLEAGSASLIFNCMPQRFLKTGENPITFNTSGSSIINPTAFNAKPLIQVFCVAETAGSITINGKQITITEDNTDTEFILDCETEYAYSGVMSSSHIGIGTVVYGDYPILSSGSNLVSFSGCVESLTIIPRWWTL